MLAREVLTRSGTARRSTTASAAGWATSTTRASRHFAAARRSFGRPPAWSSGAPNRSSVPVEALLPPGIASLVIAVHLPETGLS